MYLENVKCFFEVRGYPWLYTRQSTTLFNQCSVRVLEIICVWDICEDTFVHLKNAVKLK